MNQSITKPTHDPGASGQIEHATIVSRTHEQIARIRDLHVETKRVALQMKLFPNWPDDRRGAPPQVLRSSIFGVLRRGRKKRIVDMPVATNDTSTMTLTGWLLDQHDFDVWLEIYHLARTLTPGGEVRFTIHAMLKRLRISSADGDAYDRLKRRLKQLMETTLTYDTPESYGGSGSLIASFRIDKKTGEAIVKTNPEMRGLWESVAWLNIEQRRSLGTNQLAKAMHAALAALPDWPPIRAERLMIRVGSDRARVRDFKDDLRHVLDNFERRGWILSYKLGRGDQGMIEIKKVPTPSQARALAARAAQGP